MKDVLGDYSICKPNKICILDKCIMYLVLFSSVVLRFTVHSRNCTIMSRGTTLAVYIEKSSSKWVTCPTCDGVDHRNRKSCHSYHVPQLVKI